MGLFILAAVSGTGKSTVAKRLLSSVPGLRVSVSHTTRAPRKGELDGVHYHFVDRETFQSMAAEGAFVEWAEYVGNLYGTAHETIQRAEADGWSLLFDIEIQGARQLKASYDSAKGIFLLPPSWGALAQRLRDRGANTDAEIAERLSWGVRELEAARTFDYLVVNDDLDVAVGVVAQICEGFTGPLGAEPAILERLIAEASGA